MSMRGSILRANNLKTFAEETWRQAYSIATICRAIARYVGMDPEQAFLLGLLHDIGKVSLLHMVWKESSKEDNVSPALMGNLYRLFHEELGRLVASEWNLSEEVVSVAGCHHDFQANETHPKSAAFVSLAHKMDLYLSMGYEGEFFSLIESDEVQVLFAADVGKARAMLNAGQEAFQETYERQLAGLA
jgi:HD-like signal output (HDOD) protein